MNVKELIEKYEYMSHACFRRVDTLEVLKDLRQLDEPEKVKIPQVIAEYIKQKKDDDYHLLGAMIEIRSHKNKEIDEWFEEDDNMEIFARAWLDGYEVGGEKKYKITLLNRNDGDLYLINQNAGVSDKYGHFSPVVLLFTKGTNFSEQCYKLTKKEVASNGFGWVFDSPGFQIEEVTE
jgi:phage protein|nr:MAG TPA: Protein of unknown function (DUF1642) [Caudoviricetes sp.]